MINITNVTNRIIYNRLLRGIKKILRENIFEPNDAYTRNKIITDITLLLKRAKNHAINDYLLEIKEYDPSNPHLIELNITILFKIKIEQVILNIKNTDSNV